MLLKSVSVLQCQTPSGAVQLVRYSYQTCVNAYHICDHQTVVLANASDIVSLTSGSTYAVFHAECIEIVAKSVGGQCNDRPAELVLGTAHQQPTVLTDSACQARQCTEQPIHWDPRRDCNHAQAGVVHACHFAVSTTALHNLCTLQHCAQLNLCFVSVSALLRSNFAALTWSNRLRES